MVKLVDHHFWLSAFENCLIVLYCISYCIDISNYIVLPFPAVICAVFVRYVWNSFQGQKQRNPRNRCIEKSATGWWWWGKLHTLCQLIMVAFVIKYRIDLDLARFVRRDRFSPMKKNAFVRFYNRDAHYYVTVSHNTSVPTIGHLQLAIGTLTSHASWAWLIKICLWRQIFLRCVSRSGFDYGRAELGKLLAHV